MGELLMDIGPREVIYSRDPGFPTLLSEIEEPPEKLFVLGDAGALRPGLAIVGARKATPYGLSCAEHFAGIAARSGIPVISGGAIGCDQAAHRGALGAGGITVAVLGSGANVAYPKRGKSLFEQIVSNGGALISELDWGFPPQRWAFVRRNRIIAGLSRAVLIVEAGLPSGTFSTADFALSAGRDVLVVPGSIFSSESKGSNTLIAQGATPIIDDESFAAALDRNFAQSDASSDSPTISLAAQSLDGLQLRMLDMLTASPLTVDQVIASTGADTLVAMRKISSLETKGMVVRYPDGRFGIDPKCVVAGAR